MSIAAFGAGVQGVRAEMLKRAMAEAAAQEQIRQFEAQNARANRGLDIQEGHLGLAIEEANRPPEPAKPITMGPGGRLVDPTSGRIITEIPDRPAPPERPITLSPGGALVEPGTGRIITRIPDRPTAGDKVNKTWVLRNGQPTFTGEDQVQPGDSPYRAPQSTTETAQDRQRSARVDAAHGFLGRLNELRQRINTKMGPAAGLTGLVRRGGAALGMDPDVAEYERERAAAGRALAVAIMGAQNLSDADAAAWAGLLPDARTDEQTAQRLMQQVEKQLSTMSADLKIPGRDAPAAVEAGPAKPTAADLIRKYGSQR